jgi:imidazolonepropionase-like amidohydrolase
MSADPDSSRPHERGHLRRRIVTMLLVSALAAPWAVSAAEKITAIVGATVLHPELEGAAVAAADSTILVAGNRIMAVGPAAQTRVPRGATVIDAHGKWVIAGLIDSHVHFFQSGDLYTRPDVVDLNSLVPYGEEVRRNQARLSQTFKVYLASGVTSVADVGGPFWNFEVREAARASHAAPRVATTGPLISMVDRPQLDLGDPPIIRIESAEAARELVARELPRKPDYIKVWYIHRAGDDLAAQEAIVRATGDAAHAAGLRLAVHATELVVAKSALRAGADFLVHSVQDEPVDEEFIGLARARHILYCPTLFVPLGYAYALSGLWQPTEAEQRLADPDVLARLHLPEGTAIEHLPERMAKLIREHREPALPTVPMQNLLTVWNAGITVVMGTDAGNIGTVHGPSVFREMDLMQRSGLTALQVLKSATVNGALTVAVPDLGSLAPGKLADLVVLDADPLADLANLSRASYVLRDGRVFKPAELLQSLRTPTAP